MTKVEREDWLLSAEMNFGAIKRNKDCEAAMWRCLLRWASGMLLGDEWL